MRRLINECNTGCVIKFGSWHLSASHFQCRCGHRNGIGSKCCHGHGNEGIMGSRRLEAGLLTGVNLRTGQKVPSLSPDMLLWRQLKGRY